MTRPSTGHQEPGSILVFVFRLGHRALPSKLRFVNSDRRFSFLSDYLYFNGYTAAAPPKRRKVKSFLVLVSKGCAFRIARLLTEFNKAVKFHCMRLPIGFVSVGVGSENGVGVDDYGGNGLRDEGQGLLAEGRDHLNGVEPASPKKF